MTTALFLSVFCIAFYAAKGGFLANAAPEVTRPVVERDWTIDPPTMRAALEPVPPLVAPLPQTAPVQTTDAMQVRTEAPASEDSVEIKAAERLQIRFQGHPDLTGEYRIGSDGTISVPVIGRIAVGAMKAAELETALAERVARFTGREAFVTVEVTEYKPVFVAGHVAKSGAFPWRPGMNVLQAVTLAGGTAQSVGETGELERLQKAVANQARNLASLARLDAEWNEASEIAMPAALLALVGRDEAEKLIKAQTSEIVSRNASLAAKRMALKTALDTSNLELEALNQQSKRVKEQLDARVKLKSQVEDLQQRGYVRTERAVDAAATVAGLEERGTSIAVAIVRVRAVIAGLERDEINLHHERKADSDTERFRGGREIAQTDIEREA
ncbi:MAG: polysaccharide biosynthesis/export family protein, partial [Hyphomicrobium sp.]